jgi:hypothetical protein
MWPNCGGVLGNVATRGEVLGSVTKMWRSAHEHFVSKSKAQLLCMHNFADACMHMQ